MEKVIITVAVNGGLTTRDQNPNLPITPEEIAKSTLESYKAGASVVHLHTRDPLTGKPVQEFGLYKEYIRLIREKCNIIINVSTGGAPGATFEDRIGIIPLLSADKKTKPEMASFNAGMVLAGIYSQKKRAFVFDVPMLNPWSQLLNFATTMTTHGVKPEIEIYEAGMINNAEFLHGIGALKAPLHFQFVLGLLGTLQATVENLIFLKNSIRQGATWSICALSTAIFSLAPVAISCDGNVRVGLEDSVHISQGILAESNAQMVEKVVRMSKEMGREIATPDEARKILSIG